MTRVRPLASQGCAWPRLRGAIGRRAVRRLGASKDLAGCGEIRQDDSVEGEDSDEAGRGGPASLWRRSFDRCLCCHSSSMTEVVDLQHASRAPDARGGLLRPRRRGLVFVLLMSLLKGPTRRNFNAIFVGGAMGAYISGGTRVVGASLRRCRKLRRVPRSPRRSLHRRRSDGPFKALDFQEPYLRAILGFIGLTDVETIRVEGLNMGPVAAARRVANAKARIARLLPAVAA